MWRSPVIALMPDLTPRQLRSKANGVINLMGGIGSIIAFLIGGIFLASLDNTGRLTFGMGSIVMVLALIFLVIFIREPVADAWMRAQREQVGKRLSAKEFSKTLAEEEFAEIKDKGGLDRKLTSEKKSLILLFRGDFLLFCAYNAIETFFTLFATNVLNVSTGVATIMLTSFSLTFVAFALPAGLIAGKRGRKKDHRERTVPLDRLHAPHDFH